MRRWNGWGDTAIEQPLKPEALGFLADVVGPGTAPNDAAYEAALAQVAAQPSRLPPHPLIDTSPAARLAASFGQSCADWLRLRFGALGRVSDGVAFPETCETVRELLDWALGHGVSVRPCGGATSVVGHLSPAGDKPVLTMNLTRMMRLTALDRDAQLATFEAGVLGPDLEAQLRAHGYTLGHFPQSFEYSTLGGWVVTRSSGQQSSRFGRIEQLFAGGHLETPSGPLDLPTFPASAAGPDLREWVLGSEGRFGVLTDATVRVTRLPEAEQFIGVFFPDWARAQAAVQALAQARIGLSMMRLANPIETLTTLKLAGHAAAIGWLERYLALRGAGADKCLLFAGFSGSKAQLRAMRRQAGAIIRAHGGVSTGQLLGEKWRATRFRGVYLRNSLWAAGYAVDTMETACDWPRVAPMMAAIETAGRDALATFGERTHCYTHLSHVYPQGSSVYSTFVFRVGPDFETSFARWQALKRAVSQAIVAQGGTITHQHGVGQDHAPWLAAEKGAAGLAMLDAVRRQLDPLGVMTPGNLFGDRD
ncbi:FAD-binding oxidoreductase [Niveibacterium sp. COAC-50]|uniref:FAD-binding oxidoreductase n=1 Tax=Niveibacterium sp. COAC-50 TaxID=2729384 RepID=UPI00155396C7|nr:FAD-binding oxidoreductase [Niveibacterium sp. COAC-50]